MFVRNTGTQEYCTLQYEINKIRKYKMSHINKMVNSQIKNKSNTDRNTEVNRNTENCTNV